LIQKGRLDEAEALAAEGTKRQPREAGNWFVAGRCQEKAGRLKEAEKSYFEAVSLDRQQAEAWNNLGILVAGRNDAKAALKCFFSAYFADPYNTEIRYNLGRTLVITKTDHEKGVRLVMAAEKGKGPAAKKARQFIKDLEKIAAGGDPGWGGTKP
jgi:Flp pilus assembly protein TadD